MKVCEICKIEFKKKVWDCWDRYLNRKYCSMSCARRSRGSIKNSMSPAYAKLYKETHISVRYSIARSSAKRRGLMWNISIEQYIDLMQKSCHYCDGVLSKQGTGLDRIDNMCGYLIDNVVSCCGTCNVWRSDKFTSDETRIAMQAVKKFRQNKNNKIEVY